MSCWCPVCNGTGLVFWERGEPRPCAYDEKDEAQDCPACDGNGIEPIGESDD